jgi:hypothetical protein
MAVADVEKPEAKVKPIALKPRPITPPSRLAAQQREATRAREASVARFLRRFSSGR